MKKLLVLGIGNRLMMDDGIGIYIVEELQKININSDIQYIVGETDVYYCLQQIEKASMTIVIDAAYLNKEPGSIGVLPLEQISQDLVSAITVHDTHLLNYIGINGMKVKGMLIGIEPYKINFGTSLSSVLESKFLGICKDVKGIIEDCVKNKKASTQ